MRVNGHAASVERDMSTPAKGTAMLNARRSLTILTLLAAGAIAAFAAPAQADGLTPEKLTEHGWTCFGTPPFVSPPRMVCANPGLGRPFPGNPDPPPAYNMRTFGLAGNFPGHVHLIPSDLYLGQPCGPSGAP